MYNLLKLFEFEKEAQEFSDKNCESKGIPYELSFTNGMAFALVFPHDIEASYENDEDLFYCEDGSFKTRHDLDSSNENTMFDCEDCSEFYISSSDNKKTCCPSCLKKQDNYNGPSNELE